jgi:ketosteroid isomerase-like protein
MAQLMVSNLDKDGERRPFAGHGHAVIGNAGAASLLRTVFEPGWRWSNDIKPIAKTDSCRVHHLGYVVSGSLRVRLDDGTEAEFGPGDLYDIPAGHDGWVTSDVPCEMVDFSPDATKYAVGMPAGLAEPDDEAMKVVRRGYEAFNAGDMETLRSLMAADVAQHVPGHGQLSGTYKGIDRVLEYYGRLAELSGGTFRADLIDVHGDGAAHVVAVNQLTAVVNGKKRVTRGSILFTFVGDKVTDMLELRADLPGDDAFYG